MISKMVRKPPSVANAVHEHVHLGLDVVHELCYMVNSSVCSRPIADVAASCPFQTTAESARSQADEGRSAGTGTMRRKNALPGSASKPCN